MVFSIDVQRYELFPTSHPFHMKIFVLKMANAQTLNFVHTKVHRRDFCVRVLYRHMCQVPVPLASDNKASLLEIETGRDASDR